MELENESQKRQVPCLPVGATAEEELDQTAVSAQTSLLQSLIQSHSSLEPHTHSHVHRSLLNEFHK